MSDILESLKEAIRTFERQGGTVDAALWAVKDVFKKPYQPVRRGESAEHKARNDEIAARLRAGESFRDLERTSGLSDGRIKQIARSRGIPTNSRAPVNAAYAARNKSIVEMQQAGMRFSHIAKAFGLSVTRVSQILRKHERQVRRQEEILKKAHQPMTGDMPAYEWAVHVGLSVRTTQCIRYMEPPVTLDDLRQMPDQELLDIPNFGRGSLHELREALACAALLKGV